MNLYDPVTLAIVLALMALVPTVAVVSTSFLKISIVMMLVRNALGVQQAPPNIAVYGMALILSAYVMAPVGSRVLDAIGGTGVPGMLAPWQTGSEASPGRAANGAAWPNAVANTDTLSDPHSNARANLNGGMSSAANGTNSANSANGMSSASGARQLDASSVNALLAGMRAGTEPLKDFLSRNSNADHVAFFLNTARRLWKATIPGEVTPRDLLILVPAFMMSELDAAFKAGFLLYLPFVLIDLIVSNVLLAMGMMMVSPVTISLPLKLFLFVMADGWTRLIQGLVLSYH